MKTKLPKLKSRCDCSLCKSSRFISRIQKLLPEKPAKQLGQIWDAMNDEAALAEMEIASLSNWKVETQIEGIRCRRKIALEFLRRTEPI